VKIEFIEPPGTVEGGDVLRVENHFYIGLSRRTNNGGARQLTHILRNYGFDTSTVLVDKSLHLKAGVTYAGRDILVAVDEFVRKPEFQKFNIVRIPKDENFAANCLRINDYLFIAKGFPTTKSLLEKTGFSITELEMSEFQKMDGGLTCLSLFF